MEVSPKSMDGLDSMEIATILIKLIKFCQLALWSGKMRALPENGNWKSNIITKTNQNRRSFPCSKPQKLLLMEPSVQRKEILLQILTFRQEWSETQWNPYGLRWNPSALLPRRNFRRNLQRRNKLSKAFPPNTKFQEFQILKQFYHISINQRFPTFLHIYFFGLIPHLTFIWLSIPPTTTTTTTDQYPSCVPQAQNYCCDHTLVCCIGYTYQTQKTTHTL